MSDYSDIFGHKITKEKVRALNEGFTGVWWEEQVMPMLESWIEVKQKKREGLASQYFNVDESKRGDIKDEILRVDGDIRSFRRLLTLKGAVHTDLFGKIAKALAPTT